MEQRTLLAFYRWLGGMQGDWNNPASWVTGAKTPGVPGAADSAVILATTTGSGTPNTPVTIHIPQGAQVGSLTISVPEIVLEGGSLTVEDVSFGKTTTLKKIQFHVDQKLELTGGTFTIDSGRLTIGSQVPQSNEPTEGVIVRPGGRFTLFDQVEVNAKTVQTETTPPTSALGSIQSERGELGIKGQVRFSGQLINQGHLYLTKTDGGATAPPSVVSQDAVLEVRGHFEQGSDGLVAMKGDDASHPSAPWLIVMSKADAGGQGFVPATAKLAGTIDLPVIPNRLRPSAGQPVPEPRSLTFGALVSVEGQAEGRFDNVMGGTQFGYTELESDRFLGVQYPTSKPAIPAPGIFSDVDLLFLETPRLIDKIGNAWTDQDPTQTGRKNRLQKAAKPGQFQATIEAGDSLVLIVPGTISDVGDWAIPMAAGIAAHSIPNTDVAVFNWTQYSTGNPADPVHGVGDWQPFLASATAIDIGEALAFWMWNTYDLSHGVRGFLNEYKHIHLISHSGGAWLVDSLADALKKLPTTRSRSLGGAPEDEPFIHLTLLDPFNPNGTGGWLDALSPVANVAGYTNVQTTRLVIPGDYTTPILGDSADYADNFIDTRQVRWDVSYYFGAVSAINPFASAAVPMTDDPLDQFFNVDVTQADPTWSATIPVANFEQAQSVSGDPYALRAHAWPYLYYTETTRGGSPGWSDSFESRGIEPTHDNAHPRGNVPPLTLSSQSTSLDASLILAQAQIAGQVLLAPVGGVHAILQPSSTAPASVQTDFQMVADANQLRLSVLLDQTQNVTLRVLIDNQELGIIDRLTLSQFSAVPAISDVAFTLGGNVSAGLHTLKLIAETLTGTDTNRAFVAIGPLSLRRSIPTTPTGPPPVKLLNTQDATKTRKGKTASTVTFTFDAKVTVAKDAAQAVDANGKSLKPTTKTTFKNGQGIVTIKVSGTGPLTLSLDGSKIKGPKNELADPDSNGIGGGVKQVRLG